MNGSVSLSYFWWCGYFWGSQVSFLKTDEFSVSATEIASLVSHKLKAYLSVFGLFLTQQIMAIFQKNVNKNFESHNSLKLSFTNFQGLHLNFAESESFLESNSLNIIVLCEANFDDLAYNYSSEIFHVRICLNSVFLLLLVNFVNAFRLKLMSLLFLIIIIRSSLISIVSTIIHKTFGTNSSFHMK